MTFYMGADVGYSKCGYGVIEDNATGLTMVKCGVITTPASTPFPQRLSTVMVKVMRLLADYGIDVLGVEHPLHGKNSTNSVEVGAAYGAVLLAGVEMDVPTLILWPTQVKAAVANGRASKAEVRRGVEVLLEIELAGPDDLSDALACAICCRDRWQLNERVRDDASEMPKG